MKVFLVGGAVRDELLGLNPKDRDFVVVGSTPEEMVEKGFQQVGQDFPVFLHPETGDEYALARIERKVGVGYSGFSCETKEVTLEDDLLRRDLTINAMAKDADGNIIDPFGGQNDLENKVLRHVSEAFAEDPVRVLRVARFKARYNFNIADETLALMYELVDSGELNNLTKERVWAETEKAMAEPHPEEFFHCLFNVGAMAVLFPEMNGLETVLPMKMAATNNPAGMFAAATAHMNPSVVSQMCERMKAPTQWRRIAVMVSHIIREDVRDMLEAETVMELFEKTDAIRHPEDFVEAVRADPTNTFRSPHFAKSALVAMNSEKVKVTEQEIATIPRDQLGAIKRMKRIAVLDQMLKSGRF